MTGQRSSRKTILKNSFFLYIRMLLYIAISLYTSRVILRTLGEVDFGIYGIVGGVVALFTFLNVSMSGATSRFLTYELGTGNPSTLRDTFSSALLIHICIAVVILLLAETVGLWFFYNKLVIPEERMFAAHWVYQFSVLSMMVSVTQVPYNASIISHEKMDVYAYVELLNVTLKLLIVFLLINSGWDKLITYSFLVLIVSIVIAFIYRRYCLKHFSETHFKYCYKPTILKPMLSFSLWNMFGDMSVSFRQHGTNIIINLFYGVILNAASSIATTVRSVVEGFSNNIIQAFRPQIVITYSVGDYEGMQKLIKDAILLGTIMTMMVSVPLYMELDYVFALWLGDVPDYTVTFCKILLLLNVVGVLNYVFVAAIRATGKIKKISFLTGIISLLNLPVIYITYKLTTNYPELAYIIRLFSAVSITIMSIIVLRRGIPSLRLRPVIVKAITTLLLGLGCTLFVWPIKLYMEENFVRLLLVVFVYIATLCLTSYYVLLDKESRLMVRTIILKKLSLKK